MYSPGNSFCWTLYLLILLTASHGRARGQEDHYAPPTPVMHDQKDWTLSIAPVYAWHPDAHPRIAGELNSTVFLGRFFSLNANLAAGQGYFQFGTGIIGVPGLIAAGSSPLLESVSLEDMLFWIVMLGLAFENFNLHIPLTSHVEICPYLSLLRVKYIEEGYGGSRSAWNANGVGGLRLNIYLSGRFFIAPFAEATRDWGSGSRGLWGVSGGIQAGFYFRRNRSIE